MDTGLYLAMFDARLRARSPTARRIARTTMEHQVAGRDRRPRTTQDVRLGGPRGVTMRAVLVEFFEELRDEDLDDEDLLEPKPPGVPSDGPRNLRDA